MKKKIVVGLGNPDPEYQKTRHNVGFLFVDYLAKKLGANDFSKDKKSGALISQSQIGKNKVLLVKPQNYVNKSGEVVSMLSKANKIKTEDIVIIQDDLDIEFGRIKLSFDRNSGGHKGIESIIKGLKSKKFWRIRLGIATKNLWKARQQSDSKRDAFVYDFVLSSFTDKEKLILNKMNAEALKRLENIP